jgi:hypothetical protein
MSASRHLSNKLRETLGSEAGEELMTWLDEERSERQNLRADFGTLRADFAELRQEMQAGFARVSADVTAQIHALDLKLAERIHVLDKRVVETKADLMKWSLVFWVGAVGAIAALAGVLR